MTAEQGAAVSAGWDRPWTSVPLRLVEDTGWTPKDGDEFASDTGGASAVQIAAAGAGGAPASPSARAVALSRAGATRARRAVRRAVRRAAALRPTQDRLRVARDLVRAGGVGALVRRARQKIRAERAAASKVVEPTFDTTRVVHADPWSEHLPLVTVVVPNYNNGQFLAQCLSSLGRQTMRRLEVLVVDSASSDPASVEALAALESRPPIPFRVLRRPERHLLGCNRNAGWQEARGRYICSVDPDDLLAPTYLDACLFHLEFQNYDVVGAGVRYFEGSDGWWADMPLTSALEDALERCPTSAPALVRRDLLAAAGGYHDTGLGCDLIYEDWKFWVRALAVGARLRNLPAQLLEVRVHEAGQSRHTAIPDLPAQRAAIASYNRDVLTPAALERSRQRARTRYVVAGAEAALATPAGAPAVLLMIADLDSGRDAVVRSAASRWAAAGRRLVVVAQTAPSARGIGWAGAADLGTDDVHVLSELLPTAEWLDFCRYLVATKHVTEAWRVLSGQPDAFMRDLPVAIPHVRVADILTEDFEQLEIV